MNKLLSCKKYLLAFLIINSFNNSAVGKERNCLNYPYPNGIYLKSNFNKQQLIYTQSAHIKSKNIRKIVFNKRKNDLFAMASLHKQIKLNFPNYDQQNIGIYRIYSCFDNKGTYKISYAQRVNSLKGLSILKKVKLFIDEKFNRD